MTENYTINLEECKRVLGHEWSYMGMNDGKYYWYCSICGYSKVKEVVVLYD